MECFWCRDEDPSTLDSVVLVWTRITVLEELVFGFFGKPIVVEGLRGILRRELEALQSVITQDCV